MLKKLLSPIIYAAFLAPVFFLDSIVLGVTVMELEEHSVVIFIFLILFATVSTFLFWLGNKLMTRLEKLHKPKIADHFHQSSICYLAIVVILFEIFKVQAQTEFNPSKLIRAGILAMVISLWAIFVNGIFLYKHHKANILSQPPII